MHTALYSFLLGGFLSILAFCSPAQLFAQAADTAREAAPAGADTLGPGKNQQRQPIMLGVFIGPVFSSSARMFFDDYTGIINGNATEFDIPTGFGAYSKMYLHRWLRIGASVESYLLSMAESFDETVRDPATANVVGERFNFEDIQMRNIPFFVFAELVPVEAQFRTYTGLGLGAAFGTIFWSEAVSSNVKDDLRSGGLHIDETFIAPAMRLYVGVELGFDQYNSGSFLHSLFVELRFSYIPVSLPMFRTMAQQYENPPPGWQEDVIIDSGGLALVIGVNMEFRPPRK